MRITSTSHADGMAAYLSRFGDCTVGLYINKLWKIGDKAYAAMYIHCVSNISIADSDGTARRGDSRPVDHRAVHTTGRDQQVTDVGRLLTSLGHVHRRQLLSMTDR